jgi:hypothetical protein
MRKLVLTGAVLLAATPAIADTWTGAYDATIVSTYGDGRVVKVYVNADHSYSIGLPDGKTLKGTWADADGHRCFKLSDGGGKPTCFPIKEYKIGDTFSGEDSTGKFTGVIQAGR